MRRREFITLVGGAVVAWPMVARAQGNTARLGVIGPNRESTQAGFAYSTLLEELSKLGFAEGRNLVVEFRSSDDGAAQSFTGLNEMVAAKAQVLFAFGPELALQAAAAARPSVPIVVLAVNFDPIARGYVRSLAQPGGNVTGVVSRQLELATKQLALLAEAFPDRIRVAALWDAQSADQFGAAERAAQSSLHSVKLEDPPYDFDFTFRSLTQDGVQSVLVLSSPLFIPYRRKLPRWLSNIGCLRSTFSSTTSRWAG